MITHVAIGRNRRRAAAGGGGTAGWRTACLLSFGAFLGLGLAAFAAGILPGDLSLRRELMTGDHTLAATVAYWVNFGGRWQVLLPASLLLFSLSRAARQRWWLWCGVLLTSGLIEQGFKVLVDRPRPSGSSLGFPSGHTTSATAFAVVVIYLMSRERLSPAARLSLQVLVVALMLLVGWARIVLRAHWPTDVLGGLLLGTGCAAAAAWWDRTREAGPR